MNQTEQVIGVMKALGGVSTLGRLYQTVDSSGWSTATPFATIRRIVQNERYFFKIKAGLWARMKMLYGWDLAGIIPLVFPHSPNGACVVGGRRMSKAESALTAYQRWTGNLGNACKIKINVPNGNPSHYLPYFKRGGIPVLGY